MLNVFTAPAFSIRELTAKQAEESDRIKAHNLNMRAERKQAARKRAKPATWGTEPHPSAKPPTVA